MNARLQVFQVVFRRLEQNKGVEERSRVEFLLAKTRDHKENIMNRSKASAWVLTALCFSLASLCHAQEKSVKKSDLPVAVQKTADEQSKGATVRGYSQETEGGKVMYEVKLTAHGHSKSVGIDETGNVMEIEEQVEFDKLSPEVRNGLQNKAGDGKITKVESIMKHGTVVAYEVQVLTGTKRTEVQVGPDGKPLDHEE
jgi:uncharacterized membrane protein YkoI